jgi:cytochrome c biogenesis protein CcdA/glutaredoxin-related protein
MTAEKRTLRKRFSIVVLLVLIALFLIPPSFAEEIPGQGAVSILAIGNTGEFSPAQFEDGKPVLYFFFNRNCADCLKTLPYIEEFQGTHPDVVVHYIDIRESDENLALFHSFRDYYGTGFVPVPTVFIGNVTLSGYDAIIEGLPDAVIGTPVNQSGNEIPADREISGGTLTVPLVITAALADGINPCAFAVLIFLMLTLISLESRKKMFIVGSVFIFAVFCFYFLSGLGIFAIIQSAGISRIISFIAALIAIAAGILSILSVIGGESGPAFLSIPERGKGIIEPYIKKASIPAAFTVGLLVGMFELPCTGGIYLAILSLLSNRMNVMEGIPYLLLYNLFFILPLVIILGIFVIGFPVERLEQWRTGSRRGVRVIMGVVMILLGIILLLEIL